MSKLIGWMVKQFWYSNTRSECLAQQKGDALHWDQEPFYNRPIYYSISINYLGIRTFPSSLVHNYNLTQYNYIIAPEYAQHIGPERGITQKSREVIQKRPKLQLLVIVNELVAVLVYSGAGCGQRKLEGFASIPEVFSHPGSYPIGGRMSVPFLH